MLRGSSADASAIDPRGLQYDALTSDVSGEDSSPDFFWDAAGKVTETGWSLEIKIPFTSLRYAETAAPTWGILLYRNYPRDRRYQFFSARLVATTTAHAGASSARKNAACASRSAGVTVSPQVTGCGSTPSHSRNSKY